jgi:predicted AAA+ superfamily ATPase
LFHAQVINTAALARDAGLARTTVNAYVDLLEDTLPAFRVPAFEARLRVRERRHPKLYWIDPGLVRAVKKQEGSFVGQHDRETGMPIPDHISARPEDLDSLIEGLGAFDSDAVIGSGYSRDVRPNDENGHLGRSTPRHLNELHPCNIEA